MICALIAYGPNNVEVPCRFWTDVEKALADSIKLLGVPTTKKNGDLCWYVYDTDHRDNVSFLLITKPGVAELDSYGYESRTDYLVAVREITNPVPAKNIFTHFYDGCGGVGNFKLCEIQEGSPCVKFDLD